MLWSSLVVQRFAFNFVIASSMKMSCECHGLHLSGIEYQLAVHRISYTQCLLLRIWSDLNRSYCSSDEHDHEKT
ncbi:MAG TPA: hypothetical protein DIW81_27805 [Planctomycetaceae bacterium]|nr:hypothetical protein [Rubinisphaera sp.]HCS55344.1 hypothetical protein [Planctomycetaceae bacterium]